MIESDDIDLERMPVLDKLDYRRTLQRLIDKCIDTLGTMSFGHNVNRLVLCIETEFPNMDFAQPIKEKKEALVEEYYCKLDKLKEDYEIWNHPLLKGVEESKYQEKYFISLFEFIRDILAQNRGLLFGRADSKGMGYSEVE